MPVKTNKTLRLGLVCYSFHLTPPHTHFPLHFPFLFPLQLCVVSHSGHVRLKAPFLPNTTPSLSPREPNILDSARVFHTHAHAHAHQPVDRCTVLDSQRTHPADARPPTPPPPTSFHPPRPRSVSPTRCSPFSKSFSLLCCRPLFFDRTKWCQITTSLSHPILPFLSSPPSIPLSSQS